MRELKFRAWYSKTSSMYYSKDIRPNYSTGIVSWISAYEFSFNSNGSVCLMLPIDYPVTNAVDGRFLRTEKIMMQVRDAEIMQYTGLKDKNGEEVYEGDIVKVNYQMYINGYIQDMILKAEIIFHSAAFCLSYDSEEDGSVIVPIDSFHIPLDPDFDLQVIGNIYEHPHLLKA